MAVVLAVSGAALAVVGLTVARVVPHPVQTSYLGSYAESTGDSWNSTAGVMLSSPTVRSTLSRSGPGVLASLLGSTYQSSGLTILGAFPPAGTNSSVTRSAGRATGAPVPFVVREAQKDDRPVAQLSGPAGPAGERAATIELAVPLTQGHRVVAVIAATGPAPGLVQSVQDEVAKINLVLGVGLGLLWCILGALAWRRNGGRIRMPPPERQLPTPSYRDHHSRTRWTLGTWGRPRA